MPTHVKKPKLMIVDDGDRYVELAHTLLRDYQYATRCELDAPCWRCRYRKGCQLTHAHDWSETVQALARHPDLDVILLDVSFDLPPTRLLLRADDDVERSRRLQGIEILRRLRQTHQNLPVVLMTSLQELRFEDAAEALQVDEFVTLAGSDALDARALGLLIERIIARKTIEEDTAGFLWGKTAKMARLRQDVFGLARTSLPMLLLGVTFVFSRRTFAQLRAHHWPGNVRELESVVANASIFALSDALRAAENRRAATATAPGAIPVAAKLVSELLHGSLIGSETESAVEGHRLFVDVHPAANLSSVSRDLERQVLRHLFEQTQGDFTLMASRLLRGDPDTNGRRIRLRFNQLGLRVRKMRAKG